jgi:hypothetical protein
MEARPLDRPAPDSIILSRRDLLRASALGGVALFLAACGSGRHLGDRLGRGTHTVGAVAVRLARSVEPRDSAAESGAESFVRGGPGPSREDRRPADRRVPWLPPRADAVAPDRAGDRGLGGVILFDRDQPTGARRNVLSPAQVRTLASDLRAAAGDRPIFVSTDQEGGIVTRLGPAHGFPAVASEAEIGGGTTARARAWAKTIATTLATAGLNLNLAPVVDLDVNRRARRSAPSIDRSRRIPVSWFASPRSRSRPTGLPGWRPPSSTSRDRQLDDEHRLRRRRRDQDLERG